jgi:adenosyl cobinamide kinase/adenosyl cobinamide phosphate guanylyltransferase
VLHLVIGLAKSGKSEYAERLMNSFRGPTVYIGTLPTAPYYTGIIRDHQERRPPDWQLIELIGDPTTDLRVLSDTLQNFHNVLLDGLLFYLLRLITIFDEDLIAIGQEALSLISQVAARGEIVIVDPPVPKVLTAYERKLLRIAQRLLIIQADTITLVTNGRAVPLDGVQPPRPNHRQVNYYKAIKKRIFLGLRL